MNNISKHLKTGAFAILLIMCAATLLFSCRGDGRGNTDASRHALADTLLEQAYDNYDAADFDKSLDLTYKALDLYRSERDSAMVSDAFAQLSACYQRMSMTDSALSSSLQGLEIDRALNDSMRLSSSYNNLAAIHLTAEKPSLARNYIKRAIAIQEDMARRDAENRSTLSVRYGIAAEVYLKLNTIDSALHYAGKALRLDSVAGDSVKMARRMSVLGDIYTASGEYGTALGRYNQAIALMRLTGDKYSLMLTHKNLGALHEKTGNTRQAIDNLRQSAELARECKATKALQQTYATMASCMETRDPAEALQYMRLSSDLKDSIYNSATADIATHYAVVMESQRRQHTIEAQQQAITNQRLVIIVIATVLLLLIISAVALVAVNAMRKKTQRAKQAATITLIEAKNKEFVEKVMGIIAVNIGNPQMNSAFLADKMHLSQRQLNRKVKNLTGSDTASHIRQMRIAAAQEMLRSTTDPVSEIAERCGFESNSYFAKIFKQVTQLTPTQYRAAFTQQ